MGASCREANCLGGELSEYRRKWGGDREGSQSPTSRTPFSRLPYFFVPLSPDSRPLLCFSRYHVNHAVWLRILIGRECFGLVQNKKLCCKSNHSALSSAIIEAAFLRYKFTPRGKIFSVLWTTVVRSELRGRSSMDGFFPTTSKNTETDQNGLWPASYPDVSRDENVCAKEGGKVVFDDIWPDSLCRSYGEFRQLAKQTRHWYDWHSRHTCTCVLWEGFQFHRKYEFSFFDFSRV